MSYEHVLVDVSEGVGTLTLNRPDKLNAFAGNMRSEIADAIEQLAADPEVRVLVVTGAGRGFCAGADVRYMAQLLERGDSKGMEALVEAGRRAVTAIRSAAKPVVGSINGVAAGGGANLALACDIRIASANASLMQSFNRIGLHADWGGTYFLPRLVGPAKALELLWTAEAIDASECLRLGLFNRVVPHEELQSTTAAFARLLAAKPALPVEYSKRAVYQSLDSDLSAMLDFELRAQLACFSTSDAAEGIRAFTEKRAPLFGAGGAQHSRGGS